MASCQLLLSCGVNSAASHELVANNGVSVGHDHGATSCWGAQPAGVSPGGGCTSCKGAVTPCCILCRVSTAGGAVLCRDDEAEEPNELCMIADLDDPADLLSSGP